MSRYMFILKRTDEAFAADRDLDFGEMLAAMGRCNQQLRDAGALVAGEGLAPVEEGFVVEFGTTPPVMTDGPLAETHEIFDGYWIVELATPEEARAWASRVPVGHGSRVEVRRIHSIGDGPDGADYRKAEQDRLDRTGRR